MPFPRYTSETLRAETVICFGGDTEGKNKKVNELHKGSVIGEIAALQLQKTIRTYCKKTGLSRGMSASPHLPEVLGLASHRTATLTAKTVEPPL